MKTARAAIFQYANQPFSVQEVPIPALRPGEILVRNRYTTLCKSDLHTFCGKRTEKSPTILGHEIVGEIVAFHPEHPQTDLRGESLQTGHRISWAIFASNPDQAIAKAGIPQKAPDLFKYGHEQITAAEHLHGGLAEYTILRKHTPILKLADPVPTPVAATLNCAMSTIAGALRLAGPLHGKQVLISGTGMLGVIACAMSKAAGASQILARDTDADRLMMATKFGAEVTYLATESLPDNVCDIVIECSGVNRAMTETLNALSIGGTAVWVGAVFPQPALSITAEQIVRRLLTIRGLHNYNEQDFLYAADFLTENHARFPFSELIEEEFPLSQVNEAFDFAVAKNVFRVGIKC